MALVKLEVELDNQGVIKGLKGVSEGLDNFEKKTKSTSDKVSDSIKGIGVSIAAFLTVRQVTEFTRTLITEFGEVEKGFIGVAKTTGLAGDELIDLENRIKDMSTTLAGLTVSDLQDIAETAGQLGIQGVDNISGFTETVAKFAAVTDLTADEASRAFAQISNVMKLPISEAENLGSVINELSNTTVATARDITDLSLRIGGAGKTLGLTTPQVAAFAATLRDTGTDVEVGGTSISQVFTKLLLDTEKFAKVANQNLSDFSELVRDEPVEAVKAFLAELNKLDKSAKAEAIKSLGLEGTRVVGTISKLSGGIDTLDKNLQTANDEMENAVSLQKEFDTASQGLFAQLTKTQNAIKLTAAELGEKLAPEVIEASDALREEMLPVLADLTSEIIDNALPIIVKYVDGLAGLTLLLGDFLGSTDRAKTESQKLADTFIDAKQRAREFGLEIKALKEGTDKLTEADARIIVLRQQEIDQLKKAGEALTEFKKIQEEVNKVRKDQEKGENLEKQKQDLKDLEAARKEAAERTSEIDKELQESIRVNRLETFEFQLDKLDKERQKSIDNKGNEELADILFAEKAIKLLQKKEAQKDKILQRAADKKEDMEEDAFNAELDRDIAELKADAKKAQEILKLENATGLQIEKNSASALDKKLIDLREEIAAKEQAGVDEVLIGEFTASELEKILDDQANKERQLNEFKESIAKAASDAVIDIWEGNEKDIGKIFDTTAKNFVAAMVEMEIKALLTGATIQAEMAAATAGATLLLALLGQVFIAGAGQGGGQAIKSMAERMQDVFDDFIDEFGSTLDDFAFSILDTGEKIETLTDAIEKDILDIVKAIEELQPDIEAVAAQPITAGVQIGVTPATGLSREQVREIENERIRLLELIGNKTLEVTELIQKRYDLELDRINELGDAIRDLRENQLAFVQDIDNTITEVTRRGFTPEELLSALRSDVESIQTELVSATGQDRIDLLNDLKNVQLDVFNQVEALSSSNISRIQSELAQATGDERESLLQELVKAELEFKEEQKNTLAILEDIKATGVTEFEQLLNVEIQELEELTGIRVDLENIDGSIQNMINSLNARQEEALRVLQIIGGGGAQNLGAQSISDFLAFVTGSTNTESFANGGKLGGQFKPFVAAANGGVFSEPTIGLIGEGRFKEAVVPLPDGNSIQAKVIDESPNTVININVENLFSDDLNQIIDKVNEENRKRDIGDFNIFVRSQDPQLLNLQAA